ncbi:NADH dehydrogenase FAD-containing subunit [Tamaricihabitans halophyticus]|uniref:NADH dehydrogenase FAD-containing subunit n=1 Tax=Tamaricihabitans halophyticus TaxID=1262583 RepID=A0A4R2QFB1_9PSEU|nr:FAD-dependent oxidoreductase [Tamaricihabitans halophyticus]TCP47369.1 NADH dehydrogenase FAD-containing subunit [Tamaricihabitans halophyticus]
MSPNVVVVGGGYAGTAIAKNLDEVADVVLVEPRDAFLYNVGALRGLVNPEWTDRIFLPYTKLLDRGRVIQDRAVRVAGTTVTLGSGEQLSADYLVLATGSDYPFPAKSDVVNSATAKAKLHATRETLADARNVLLLGAGPVGLELAGEINARWPDKSIVLVDQAPEILRGDYPAELRAELVSQLEARGIRLVLGSALREQPPAEPGEAKTFTAVTDSGEEIIADIWFRCHGVVPNSAYLAGELAAVRQANGHLRVTPELRVSGQERVFAVGDLTAVQEPKLAKAAGEHARLVAANIRTLLAGGTELDIYQPGGASIALPLGPAGGAAYTPEVGVLGAEQTAEIKGAHLGVDDVRITFGLG